MSKFGIYICIHLAGLLLQNENSGYSQVLREYLKAKKKETQNYDHKIAAEAAQKR